MAAQAAGAAAEISISHTASVSYSRDGSSVKATSNADAMRVLLSLFSRSYPPLQE